MTRDSDTQVPKLLSIGFPLVALLGMLLLDLILPEGRFRDDWIDSELGLVENLTVLLALLGLYYAVVGARRSRALKLPWLTLWLTLLALGFLYLAGEEANWGQHWVGWQTPDWLAERNLYGESNLHNLSYPADRIPKSLVGVCIVVFGIGWPLFRKRIAPRIPPTLDWLIRVLPGTAELPTAVCFFALWLLNRSFVVLDLYGSKDNGFAGQEHLEMLLAGYLFLYAMALAQSLPRAGPVAGNPVLQ